MKTLLAAGVLALALGLFLGYLVGAHGRKADHEALVAARAAGESAQAALGALQAKNTADLERIQQQAHEREVANQRDFDTRTAAWTQEKKGLADDLGGLRSKISAREREVAALRQGKPGAQGASGAHIDALQQELDRLRTQAQGLACLATPVPPSVLKLVG